VRRGRRSSTVGASPTRELDCSAAPHSVPRWILFYSQASDASSGSRERLSLHRVSHFACKCASSYSTLAACGSPHWHLSPSFRCKGNEAYASSAPSLGSSAASTFDRRRMLEVWISAMVYLTCWPLTVSSIARYLIFPSRLTSWPFRRVLAKLARLPQA